VSKQKTDIVQKRNLIALMASVMIVLTAGGLWFFNNKPAGTPKIAEEVKTKSMETKALTDTPSIVAKPNKNIVAAKIILPKVVKHSNKKITFTAKNLKANMAEGTHRANIQAEEKGTDTATNETPLDEMIVMDLTAKKKKNLAGGTILAVNNLKGNIKGIVVGRDNGLPVSGALVKLVNSPVETFTGTGGDFVLQVDSDKVKIDVSYPGYNRKELTVNVKDSVKIALQPKKK
jgi:hypothetical protein